MKYALIGCGRISANHIKAALTNGFDIAAVCDVLPEKMEELLKKHGLESPGRVARYTSYEKLLDDVSPDLVSIATDSGIHARIVLACIGRGINVIVEKPMAMSMADADEIVRRSDEKGVVVSACHQNRFNAAVQSARTALEAGRFGALSHGAITVRWRREQSYYDQAAWRGKWASDGGCLMNQCIHGIDLLRWMLGGEVEEVYGSTCRRFHDYMEAEDVGVAVVKFKNGAVGTIEGSVNLFRDNLEETLSLFGENGTVRLGGISANNIDYWDFADKRESDDDCKALREATSNVYGNGHIRLFADVAEAIATGRRPYVDARAGRDALEMVLAVYKSRKTGLPVRLPLADFASEDMAGTF